MKFRRQPKAFRSRASHFSNTTRRPRQQSRRTSMAWDVRFCFELLEGRELLSVSPPDAYQLALQNFDGTDMQKDGLTTKVGFGLSLLDAEYQTDAPQTGPVTIDPLAFAATSTITILPGSLVPIDASPSGSLSTLETDMQTLGMQITGVAGNDVSALLPVSEIEAFAQLSSLESATPADAGVGVGSVTTQGDKAELSDETRQFLGFNGAGQTVGILSDSYNNKLGAPTDVVHGDLPGVGNPDGYVSPVNVIQDLPGAGGTDEGRAMLQIVHDVAPAAKLAFGTASLGQAAFANNITALRNAGATVIADDVFYFQEPYFQDGVISQAVDASVAAGVPYFALAGNSGRNSYENPFNPDPGGALAAGSIPSDPGAPAFAGGVPHDFGAAGQYLQSVTVPNNGVVHLGFQWNDPYHSISPAHGAQTDLDIYLIDAVTGHIVAGSVNRNVGADPIEELYFKNTGSSHNYNILITKFSSGPDPTDMKWIGIQDSNFTVNNYATNSSTSWGHENSATGFAVGAADYTNTPAFGVSPAVKEPYSSAGGMPVYFDVNGNLLSTPSVRQHPDVIATDGVSTAVTGTAEFNSFFGTSAAAPHAAAVAALMLQARPGSTPAQIYSAMRTSAVPMQTPVPNFDTGFGLLQSPGAMFALGGTYTVTVNAGSLANDGNPDTFKIVQSGANDDFYVDGTLSFVAPVASVGRIDVDGSSDVDTLIVDESGGLIDPAGGIHFDAGGQAGDNLQVVGGGSNHAFYTPSSITPGSGTVTVDGSEIDFMGLSPITISGMGEFTFTTPNSNDVVTIDSPAAGQNRISGTSGGVAFESVTFFNVANVDLDTATNDNPLGNPNDTVTFTSDLVATGLKSFTVDTGAGNDVVDASKVTSMGVTLLGGSGDDTLTGASGTDPSYIDAGDGNDVIHTSGGGNFFAPTTVLAGSGADYIFVEGGYATVAGGGSDVVNFVVPDGVAGDLTVQPDGGKVQVTGTGAGGSGALVSSVGELNVEAGVSTANYTVGDLSGTGLANLGLGLDRVNATLLNSRAISGATATIEGTAQADTMTAGMTTYFDGGLFPTETTAWGNVRMSNSFTSPPPNVVIQGLGGDDTLQVNKDFFYPNVTLDGGDGNDTLIDNHGGTTFIGGAGNNVITSTAAATDTIAASSGNDTILVQGTSGNDAINLALDASGNLVVTVNGVNTTYVGIGNTNVKQIEVDGGAGTNTLTVDSTNGPITVPIFFDGGTGSNALDLVDTANTATSDVYAPGPLPGQGTDTLTFAGGTETIHFANLTPVYDSVAGPLTVNGTNGDDAINYAEGNDPTGMLNVAWGQVSVNNLEPINFTNKTKLAINGQASNDTIDIDNQQSPTKLGSISVDGGDPAASDTLIENTGTLTSPIVEPAAQGAGVVVAATLPATLFTDIEHLTLVTTLAADWSFGMDGTIGNDHFVYTPGATPDTATITGTMDQNNATGKGPFPLVPTTVVGINQHNEVVFNAFGQVGGTDDFVFNGTAGNDAIAVTLGGAFPGPLVSNVVAGQLFSLVNFAHVARGTIDSGDGDDTISVAAGAATVPLTVNGGDPSASDVLNFAGDGTSAVTADLGASAVQQAGFGAVTFSGIETLNVTAKNALTVKGTAGPDNLTYTPTSGSAGTVTLAGSNLTLNASAVTGTFTIDPAGGSDTVTVNGTNGDDTFNVSDSAVQVVGLLPVSLTTANLEALDVAGLAGNDTFNVTPSATVPISVDGGDPIGVLPGDTINLLHPPGPYQIFPGPTKDSGGLKTPGFQTVSWVHIETVVNTGGGPPIITGTNGNDEITVMARDSSYNPANPGVPNPALDGVQDFTVSVNDGPELLFVNTPNLFVDALSGNDDVVVQEPAPNQAAWNVQVFVAGGPPASGANRLGDNVELETPGTQAVTYNPNNPLSAVPAVPGVTFTSPNAGGGQFNDTTNMSTVTATQFLIPGFYQSSPGGAEDFIYAGEAGNDTLTYNTPANANAGSNLVYTPGATADAGTITGSQSGGATLTPLAFSALGGAGNVSFTTSNAGRTDHLNVEGVPTSAGESFSVTPANGGTVQLSQLPPASSIITVPILTPAVSSLELDGLGGSDLFNLTGALPYTNAIVDDGSVVNLTGAVGPVTITEGDNTVPSNPTVTGYGAPVTLIGIDTANVDAGGNTTTATGTLQNDNIIYTPTGATAGTFYDDLGSGNNLVPNTVFNIANVSGNFRVFNDPGGNADQVTLRATDARDLIEINQGSGVAQVLANNVTALLPVQLGISVEILNVLGLGGQNTFQVIPAPGIAGQAQDNLLINLDGGSTGAFNALVVGSSFGNSPGQLAANQFVVDNKNPTPNSGTVRVFTAAVADPDVNYKNVQTVSANVAGTSLNPNLLVMGPDLYEPNDQQGDASVLGSGATLNVQNATIFASSSEFPGQPADQDYYQVVAQTTGTLDFQVYFRTFNPALLPGGGNLNLQVLDASGNVIATASGGPAQFGADPGTGSARIRIPAVAGQSYFLHVFGATIPGGANNGAVVNGYNMTAINTAPPTPFNLELSRSVPAGVAGTPDTGDLPPTAPGDDTGRSQFDNVTDDNTPRIYLRLSDGIFLNDLPGNGTTNAPPVGVIPIPFSPNATTPGFRVAVFDGNNTQTPVGFASQVAGFPGLYEFDFPTALADGVHNITAEVQMVDPAKATETGFGGTSAALSLTVDTAPPPVAFGSTGVANSGLDGASDSGVNGQPTTIVDRITNVSTPTFYGVAEANSIVRLYDDLNNDGVVDAGDVFLGQVTAVPIDGTNADPGGQWRITSNVDLNNPKLGFPHDGVRNLLATAEDLAGNVSAPQRLTIFVDTQGPTVNGINITGNPTFPLFETKLTPTTTPSPTPLVSSLDINFGDLPVRVGPDFVYPAVNPTEAETTSNYALVGEHTGVIPITSVTFVDSTASGTPGMSVATLHFPAEFTPLPDDRYTLTISDKITDNAGNPLDGEFNGTTFPTGQPSGNTSTGGIFLGSFTVNSRPEVGVYSSGTAELDLNGNGVFDPQNADAVNRDAVVTLGYPTDRLFAGQFSSTYTTGAAPVVNGFDKLAAYGFLNGQWRWLYDLSGVSAGPPTSVVEPFAIDGLPVAGNFDGSPLVSTPNRPPVAADGAQVGLFDGTAWYLDVFNQGYISAADVAAPATATHPAGKLVSDMAGLPIVGDFDGDGHVDLATYQNGVLEFDLSSLDPGHIVTGQWNAKLDLNQLFPASIPFNTVTARPLAADMDADGQTDVGFYIPGRTDTNPGTAQWYFLVSNSGKTAPNELGALTTLAPLPAGSPFLNLIHQYQDPALGGHDAFYQLGDQFALPLVGNFDPPTNGSTGGTQSDNASTTATWISHLYVQILGREPGTGELTNWINQVNQGMTPSAVAQAFVDSIERLSTIITGYYEQYLGRAPDQAGLNYWIGVWVANGGPEQVQAGIISSPEYYATAGKLYPHLSHDAAWVTALYHNLLNRDVDPQGLSYWVSVIQSRSKASVVLGFVTSDEYRMNLTNSWFETYLNRPVDAASAQSLLKMMQAGMTQDALLTTILSSDEYRNMA
ncbi:MAG TPA: DUF4214 domain-containing protein [Pirellulales bacterium]|nr:DUF4214 domain-containing protein [Pirellulales bacterium]